MGCKLLYCPSGYVERLHHLKEQSQEALLTSSFPLSAHTRAPSVTAAGCVFTPELFLLLFLRHPHTSVLGALQVCHALGTWDLLSTFSSKCLVFLISEHSEKIPHHFHWSRKVQCDRSIAGLTFGLPSFSLTLCLQRPSRKATTGKYHDLHCLFFDFSFLQ